MFKKHVVGEESGTTKASQYSHVYDGMIGRYLFARMTKTFCTYFQKWDYKIVAQEISKRFHNIPGNVTTMFPQTTFKFGNRADEQEGNDVILVDTNESPEFR